MEFASFLNDGVAMALAMIGGFWLKSNPKAKEWYLTKLTPVLTFVILFVNQLSVQVAEASVGMPVGISFGGLLKFLEPALKAAIETLIVTGLYSAPKNVVQGVVSIAQAISKAPVKK